MREVERLFAEVVDTRRKVKRLSIGLGALISQSLAEPTLFVDVQAEETERRLVATTLAVKQRFGKNAIIRGRSLREEATGRDRNAQVGGHHA